MSKRYFDTRTVHNGRTPSLQGQMVNPPVYHGSTVVFSSFEELKKTKETHQLKDAVAYGRMGNQSTFALENAMADLENGFGAISVSSGLAAITTTIMAFVDSGDHLLVADTVYGPTRAFCDRYLNRMGVEVQYYDPMLGAEINHLIKSNTVMIFLESPGSVTFEVQDIPAIVEIARKRNVLTAMDNSWATPLFFRPIDYGVNISVVAATKYIVGHADAMMGLVVADNEEHFYQLKSCRDLLGQSLAPDDVFLGLRGMRTLGIRIRHHEQQALALADWLTRQPLVQKILHPALPGCTGHEFWKRDFQGSSGLFSFVIKPREEDALAALLDHLELFSMGFSWGGFESLIVPQNPALSRSATTWENPGLVLRVHVGLENIDDLIADLSAGFARYQVS
ncbi:MAG: cystathionine beta-lyase [Acidiferrobacterales bacterium]|nr:cystathionine beta-lyase [Acidiferrobacterales bacterium]